MLRLEKSSKDQDIKIHLTEKERFFTRTLYTGLAFALIFHFLAFTLFHIQPFPLISSYVFPPISIETDSSFSQTNIELLDPILAYDTSLIPPHPSPYLSMPTDIVMDKPAYTYHAYSPIAESFFNTSQAPAFIDVPTLESIPYKPLRFLVSGDLAQRPLIKEGNVKHWNEMTWMKEKGKLAHFRTQFAVRIQPETGTIFWYEKTASSGHSEIDRLAEDLLLYMCFNPSNIYEHITGSLDILITLGKEKSSNDLRKHLKI